jgi:hypothetical protein
MEIQIDKVDHFDMEEIIQQIIIIRVEVEDYFEEVLVILLMVQEVDQDSFLIHQIMLMVKLILILNTI